MIRRLEVLIAAVLLVLAALPPLQNVEVCPLKVLAGISCPTCGVTRSIWHILRGQYAAAWQANPIGYLFLFVAMLGLLRCLSPRSKVRLGGDEHAIVGFTLIAGLNSPRACI